METFQNVTQVSQKRCLPCNSFVIAVMNSRKNCNLHLACHYSRTEALDIFAEFCAWFRTPRWGGFCISCLVLSSRIRPFHIVESKVHEVQWGEGGTVGHIVGHKGEQSLLYILPYKQYSAINALYLLCIMFFYYPIIILFIVYFIKYALHSSHDCAVKARIRFRINVNIHSSTIFFKSNNKNKSE